MSRDPRRDPIHGGILTALAATVVIAAAVSILGDMRFHSAAMKHGGFAIALVAGVAYIAFRIRGARRAARHRRHDAGRHSGGGNGGGNGSGNGGGGNGGGP